MHRRRSNASRKAGRDGAVSLRALICLKALFASVCQEFTSPHFAGNSSRRSNFVRTIQCSSVGATL